MSLLPLLFALIATVLLLWYLGPIAKTMGLVARPDQRRTHEFVVPLVGGVGMSIAFGLTLLLSSLPLGEYRILFMGIGVLVGVGVLDDHKDISPLARIIAQTTVATLLVLAGQLSIHSLGEILFIAQPYGLGVLAVPFSILAIVGVINAFNMIDGHDGLAGITAIISSCAIAFLCLLDNNLTSLKFFAIFVAVLLGFLIFNLPLLVGNTRQVFMGDAGSMFVGLILVFGLINLSQSGSYTIRTTAAPWIIGLPLVDMISVLIARLTKRRSPFDADRRHVHHLLLNIGLSKYQVLGVLIATQIVFAMVGVLGTIHRWPDGILFWGMFVILGPYMLMQKISSRQA